jgi:hypothetical protein
MKIKPMNTLGSRFIRLVIFLTILVGIAVPLAPNSHASAQNSMPSTWNIFADNFESGRLDKWQLSTPIAPVVIAGGGYNGSNGLSATVSSNPSNVYQTHVAKAEEGYLTFWFNPNGVNIPDQGTTWIPGKSLSIAEVVNSTDWWPPIVALYVNHPDGQGIQAYLAWPIDSIDTRYYDYANAFPLINGWQQITIGYHINEWVAVWCDGVLKRFATNVVNTDPYGDIILLGNIRNTSNTPSGSIHFDEVAFQVPRIANLWVNANGGNDSNNGLTPATALHTIQRAGDQAGPGTTVHILPGIYRETVRPILDGTAVEPVRYIAENGPGTVTIRGSEPSSSLVWTQLTTNTIGLPPGINPNNIYSADLSLWNLTSPPRFIVELDSNGNVISRFPLARAPNWNVITEWKYHEFWWTADGGMSPAACNPSTDPDPNCDKLSRSTIQLTDQTNDLSPAGVEAGNLTTLGDLTGATLVALDDNEGTFVYRRTIISHASGRITVDKPCEIGSGSGVPGLGWGTKYYVEGKPYLLDTPGEWWYDANSKRLYLWPLNPANPAAMNIEISQQENGLILSNRSYNDLNGLDFELFNGSAIYQVNGDTEKSYGNSLENLTLLYSNYGVNIQQAVKAGSPSGNVIDGFTLEGSEIANMDSQGIRLLDWWENNANPNLFTHSGIRNTNISNNNFHDLGFRSDDDAVGLWFTFANQLRFVGNYVHHIAHNGVQFSMSVIQSTKEYGFSPGEIKTGDILIKDNIFEKACLLTSDCAGLKIYGVAPDNHVFRNLLITGNVFRNTFGWSNISEQRHIWTGGASSVVHGMGGFGLYIDNASGVYAYRNISFNNAYADYLMYGRWRDGDIVYLNNIAANSLYGMSLGGEQYDTHGSVNTQLINNILLNNEGFGIDLRYATGRTANMIIDHSLYFNNGWRTYAQGGLLKPGAMVIWDGGSYNPYQSLVDVQTNTLWEDHGISGDPGFWSYDSTDHNIQDGYWPDFHLKTTSTNLIDRGTSDLPASLNSLLSEFSVVDYRLGSAYDIGRYEAGFLIIATPNIQSMDHGGTVQYILKLFPVDVPYNVTLSNAQPPSNINLSISPTILTGSQLSTLTASDNTSVNTKQGTWYSFLITGTGAGFTNTAYLTLLAGGSHNYFPVIQK